MLIHSRLAIRMITICLVGILVTDASALPLQNKSPNSLSLNSFSNSTFPSNVIQDGTLPVTGKVKLSSETQFNHTLNLQLLADKAAKYGTVPVIIKLNITFATEGKLHDAKLIYDQRVSISKTQDTVLQNLSGHKFSKVKRFQYIPFMAMNVDSDSLKHLATLKQISEIHEDRMLSPLDVTTIPLTGTNNAWNLGYTGAGQTVAILDSGVDGTHPFLTGKVVSEACYSTPLQAGDSSLCPNGQSSQTGSGSAVPCSSSLTNCFHGTFVAGIAAGRDSSLPGFAKDAHIIAVQVFHKDTNSADCGSSTLCIEAYDSDILSGLEYVYGLRNSFSIDAVNLSVGSGGYTSTCDSSFPQYKSEFDTLQSVGIATIVSSGNNGFVNALSSPACISSAISVGSTNDSDQVSSFTNSASFLSLLAPGESVTSSVPGGGTSVGSGTSFAAPAVTGAWAVLKQKNPSASVSTILSALKTTGRSITDSGNGLSFPRIKVDSALQSLGCSPSLSGDWTVPSSCTLASTSNSTANVIVNSGAVLTIPSGMKLNIDLTHYHLLVKSGGGVLVKSGGAIN